MAELIIALRKLTFSSEEISLRVFLKRLCINHQNLLTKIKIPSRCDCTPYIIQWRYKDLRSRFLKFVFPRLLQTWLKSKILASMNRLIHLTSGWSYRHFWLAVLRHISQLDWGNVLIRIYVSIWLVLSQSDVSMIAQGKALQRHAHVKIDNTEIKCETMA